MTGKQLEQKRKNLKEEMRAESYGWIDGKYVEPPTEYKIRQNILSCVDMIDSILCYNCMGYQDAEKVLEQQENSYHNYLEEYVKTLGRETVIGLIQDQIKSIKRIETGTYTDGEGCCYNTIIYNE